MTAKQIQSLRVLAGSKSHRTDSWTWLCSDQCCTHQHLIKWQKHRFNTTQITITIMTTEMINVMPNSSTSCTSTTTIYCCMTYRKLYKIKPVTFSRKHDEHTQAISVLAQRLQNKLENKNLVQKRMPFHIMHPPVWVPSTMPISII